MKPNKDINHNYFHKIDTQEKAYWLGFILGDGCVYVNTVTSKYQISITLNIKDKTHLEKFATAINWKNSYYYNKKQNTINLTISSKQMCNDLIVHNITPRKSFTAKFPKVLKKFESHVLRGLFDADGTITNHSYWKGKPYASFSIVGSINCLENVKRILGIKNKICPDHTIWRIKKNGTPGVRKIYRIMYKNSIVSLDRKLEKFKEFYE
jgi:hypothetical protein